MAGEPPKDDLAFAAVPWREGVTDQEYEDLQRRGVRPELLFRQFFGHRKKRGKLSPPELGLWEAAIVLVFLRSDCDHIIRRDEFNTERRVAINAIRAIPRPLDA